MTKPIEAVLAPAPAARPRIYAYSIADAAHAGLLKIGQTTRDVRQGVAEQLRTAAITNYRIELDEDATRADGGAITDHQVRAALDKTRPGQLILRLGRASNETVLRRFDCVLAPTKARGLAEYDRIKDRFPGEALDARLNKVAGQRFHNHSPLDFAKLKGDPDHTQQHLVSYIRGFSANVRRIFGYFAFETEIEKLRAANLLYLVVSKFADVDLHPDRVPNAQMRLILENLIRRFNELANETAGDRFTPREVIRLMVSMLFMGDDALLATPGTVRKLLDPACGTGGVLAEGQNYLREHHPQARLHVYGQDDNKRAFATAASDMLVKQVDHNGGGDNIRFGDTFTDDQFPGEAFDDFLTNPPFGVDWKKQQKQIEREHTLFCVMTVLGP
jgi:type I restriction enzyme M protein